MPVNTPHKEHEQSSADWTLCRDFAHGQRAVKAKSELYLPKVSSQQSDAAYAAYKNRAFFYGATARTIQGLAGAVFGKSPTLQAPTGTTKDAKDITKSGITFEGFARDVVTEILTVGRHGALVDMPGEKRGVDVRPYWVPYLADNIVSWRTAVVGGDTILTRVVLKECVGAEDPKDEFVTKPVEQYRVLRLVSDTTPVYEVVIYRKNEKDEWVPGEAVRPTRRGTPLTFIPFQFFGPSRLTTEVERPPLLDLVNANLAHYQLWADRRQMLHYMGQVQAWVSGVTADQAPGEWGSGTLWTMEAPEAKAGLLQVGSDGAAPLREVCADLQELMAVLGGRLLESQVKKQEAADTVKMRRSGDIVTMRTIGQTSSDGLSQLLRWHAWWAGEMNDLKGDDVSASLNTDFFATRLSAEEIKSLTGALQTGAISWDTFYHALERGDWTEPGIDAKTERERIAASEDMMVGEKEDDEEEDPAA